MRCKNPISIKLDKKTNPLAGKHISVPCGQCLECRINKRDFWTVRALLEFRTSFSGQFWTLTFSDDALPLLAQKGPRPLVRKFMNALRMSEARASNRRKVRCFGVLEYGSDLLRPHIHLLLYNIESNLRVSTPYKPGLPRPRWNIGLWPHGHCDIQDLTPSSARYVAKYITKFDDIGETEPTAFHCQRPPLGWHGLEQHVIALSRSPMRKSQHPPIITIDGKSWALPPTMQKRFFQLCKKHNVRSTETNIWERFIDNIFTRSVEVYEPWHSQDLRFRTARTKERLYEAELDRKSLRLVQVAQRASRLALQQGVS